MNSFLKKKSQAALEFLTTYGWAFLVILIMIGTLAYFGILNPSKVLPNRCTIGPEFECIDYQISATGSTFKIKLKNNVGEPITIPLSGITLSSESATSYSCTGPTPALPQTLSSGQIIDFSWTACNSAAAGVVAGEKGKVLIKIGYFSVTSGSNYQKEANGEVFSTII